MDSVQTLDGGRRSMYDPDEIEEEQRERDQRNKVCAVCTLGSQCAHWLLRGSPCTQLLGERKDAFQSMNLHPKPQCSACQSLREGLSLCTQLPNSRSHAGLCRPGFTAPSGPCTDQAACLLLGCAGCGSLCPLTAVQINKVYQQYVKKVQQDVWERDHG